MGSNSQETHLAAPQTLRQPSPYTLTPKTKPKGLKTHALHRALSAHPRNIRKATVLAFVIQRGKVVSVGYNRKVFAQGRKWSKHAEEDALDKAGRRAAGSFLLVVRLKKDGTYGIARPCVSCEKLIESRDIGRVGWSDEGWN